MYESRRWILYKKKQHSLKFTFFNTFPVFDQNKFYKFQMICFCNHYVPNKDVSKFAISCTHSLQMYTMIPFEVKVCIFLISIWRYSDVTTVDGSNNVRKLLTSTAIELICYLSIFIFGRPFNNLLTFANQ